MPDEWLNADIKQGLTNSEVESRRKRMGWNEITSDKENLFIKFLMFFTGPILYGKSCIAISAPLQCRFCTLNGWGGGVLFLQSSAALAWGAVVAKRLGPLHCAA